MTVHMQSHVDAYEQTLRSLLGVVETLDPGQWEELGRQVLSHRAITP